MPYIICVNQPGCLPEQDPIAVATLEEARSLACDEIDISARERSRRNLTNFTIEVEQLPEDGGIIGPLPDGYVIDVQARTWSELAELAGFHAPPQYENEREELLDAYNGVN